MQLTFNNYISEINRFKNSEYCMPPNLNVKLSKLFQTWQPPELFSRMISVVTYGRLFARVFANSLTQGQLDNVSFNWSFQRRAIHSSAYSPGKCIA